MRSRLGGAAGAGVIASGQGGGGARGGRAQLARRRSDAGVESAGAGRGGGRGAPAGGAAHQHAQPPRHVRPPHRRPGRQATQYHSHHTLSYGESFLLSVMRWL